MRPFLKHKIDQYKTQNRRKRSVWFSMRIIWPPAKWPASTGKSKSVFLFVTNQRIQDWDDYSRSTNLDSLVSFLQRDKKKKISSNLFGIWRSIIKRKLLELEESSPPESIFWIYLIWILKKSFFVKVNPYSLIRYKRNTLQYFPLLPNC